MKRRLSGTTALAAGLLLQNVVAVAGEAVANVPATTLAATPPARMAAADSRADREFLAFLASAYDRLLVANPSMATEHGDASGNDRWESLGEAAAATEAVAARTELATLHREFRDAPLGDRARLQYRAFAASQELLLERYRWRNYLYPLNQIVGAPIDIPQVLGSQPVTNAAEAEAWLRRASNSSAYLDSLTERLQLQAAAGVYFPRSVYPILIGQARGLRDSIPAKESATAEWKSPLLDAFQAKVAALEVPVAMKAALLARARQVLVTDVRPAYTRVITLLEFHADRTPITGGVWQLPQGDELYRFLVRQFTTTQMTPEEVHQLGLREVARTHREMRAIMEQVGFKGDVVAFMKQAKADPQFYMNDDEAGRAAYLASARGIVAAMQAKLPMAFAKPPPLPLEILPTPDYRAAGAPSGFYTGGTADGSRPGVVYVNLTDLRTRPLYDLESLLYHESVPGHHLQIASILVDPAVPQLRKVERYWENSAFVEGWALYAERLGKEMGFYTDPYSDFGRLAAELWRASRLVVDSGLHYKRWTREQAIAWLDENTPSPHVTNEGAVDRYLAVPGQATSFMVGMQHFLAVREQARQRLGTRFDLKRFHTAVLENGYVPLWAVSDNVERWVRAEEAADQQHH